MRWVTRRHIRVNRTATAWLVRRFVDPDAEFLFVEPEGERCPNDDTLRRLALIVRSADFSEELGLTPEGAGLRAISRGFPLVSRDDDETLERAAFLRRALRLTSG
jgi:hypothetical protein